jgi:EAL domain-containing protein (putative c-di-GMP-specific phosphodiesterase class I)/GGDEF domain-containing protein
MSYRLRLALLFVATLVAVQAFTAVIVYATARRALIAEGERQLASGAAAVAHQFDDIADRVADNVQVLALDYALRSAIAQREQGTVLSALRNHGRRIGATRMLLIGLDGMVQVDTGEPTLADRRFPFADLSDAALEHASAGVVAMDGKAYWMIVVPVYAPQPIALIAAGIPVDDALLTRLQQLSALPNTIELVSDAGDGRWVDVARGTAAVAVAPQLAAERRPLPLKPMLVGHGGREYVALATHLRESQRGAPVAVLLSYSLDDALRPYRPVALAWALLLALALAAGLVGAMLIARGMARPIERLAATARSIEGGDYSRPAPVAGRGEIGALASAFASMTRAIAEREERIGHQARHDAVTGLPNRHAAEAAIQAALDASSGGALLMIGLARLPDIIQTLGHAVCDRLMRDAATRLQPFAGRALLARATDTRFSLWCAGLGRNEAIALAFRIVDALAEPYRENDLSLDTDPAVGIALHPAHGAQASVLLRRAEVALFGVPGSEEPVAVYEPATDPHRPERLTLMADLREGLERGDLHLHYQPKLRLADGCVDAVEALVRWDHPRRGAIPPDAFVPLAERTGNVRRLTRWALATAIAQAQEWAAQGHPLRVAVNLSARDLDDPELPRRITDLLAVHGVPARALVLELTESAVLGEPDTAMRVLRQLAGHGIDLAIDDFGVGQSSFAYLRRLPVRELKIDRQFTAALGREEGDGTLVRSMVELGHRLGYEVTAEGVETQEALDVLRDIGCDHAQGFFIARALPPRALHAFLAPAATAAAT